MVHYTLLNTHDENADENTNKRIRIIIQNTIIRLKPNIETEIRIPEKHEKQLLDIIESYYKDRITIL